MPPDRPDPFDAALSAVHSSVEDLGPCRAIWLARTEPDAHARRCASDAIDAIDAALAALHRIRAEWVTEIRRADDESAARADALLGRDARDGPAVVTSAPPGRPPDASSPPPPPPQQQQGSVDSPGHVEGAADVHDNWRR